MYRFMVDTNILLDVSTTSRERHDIAKVFFSTGLKHGLEFNILISSLNDFYYIFRGHYGSAEEAINHIEDFLKLCSVINLDLSIVKSALASNESDFEDGLIRAAAEINNLDAIITEDRKAYSNSSITSLSLNSAIGFLEQQEK